MRTKARTVAVSVAAALALAWGAPRADEANDAPDLVLDDARNVAWSGPDVRYSLSAICPADSVSTELTKRFEAAGWAVVESDPLDPMGHGEHLRTWSVVTIPPGRKAAIWIGWFGRNEELANVVLRCTPSAPEDAPTDVDVTIRHVRKSEL